MKLVFVLFTFFFSLSAHAMQGIGDGSSYWATSRSSAQSDAKTKASNAAKKVCQGSGNGYDWNSRRVSQNGCDEKSTSGGTRYKCSATVRMLCK